MKREDTEKDEHGDTKDTEVHRGKMFFLGMGKSKNKTLMAKRALEAAFAFDFAFSIRSVLFSAALCASVFVFLCPLFVGGFQNRTSIPPTGKNDS